MKRYLIKGLGIFPATDLYVVNVNIELEAKSMQDAIERAMIVANFRTITECKEIAK